MGRTPPRRARAAPTVAGWTNIGLGLLIGTASAVAWVAGAIGGAEALFHTLIACLLVAVGVFVIARRPVPATVFGFALLLVGIFLGFGLLLGGLLGAAETGLTKAVGMAGVLLAGLETWSIVSVWWSRRRRAVDPGS
jgi:multisubunit Na+/H+ antiporter MnhC subunit